MSNELIAVEVNCETGEEIIRPFTEEEVAQYQANAARIEEENAIREAEAAAIAAAKEAAHVKLLSLGLTSEEIAALSK